jgi:AcrR family transcriptional regulator
MDKKELQRSRMIGYFTESTVNLIKSEGLANITTKKIGDMAGYSYATIYNYFENINDLICVAIEEIAKECGEFVKKNLKGKTLKERMVNFILLMTEFNIANPNVYYPFLSTSVDFTYFWEKTGNHFFHPAYGLLVQELKSAQEFAKKKDEEILIICNILTNIFHAKMHFYLLMKSPSSLEELNKEIITEVNYFFDMVLKK